MVQGTYNIKINMLSWSQDSTNVQTTFGDYKTEDYKRSETAVVLNVTNYFGQKQFLQIHGLPFTKLDPSALNNQQHISDHLPPIPNKVNNNENPK